MNEIGSQAMRIQPRRWTIDGSLDWRLQRVGGKAAGTPTEYWRT